MKAMFWVLISRTMFSPHLKYRLCDSRAADSGFSNFPDVHNQRVCENLLEFNGNYICTKLNVLEDLSTLAVAYILSVQKSSTKSKSIRQ